MGGFCPGIAHSCLHGCSGRRQQSPSPGLAGGAAGVSPVASRRSCQSGQGETPPHANVASQRAYATLDRASATWTTLCRPWSLSWRLHPPPQCPPQPTKAPRLGSPSETHRPRGTDSSVHHCGVFSPSGETGDGATSLGEHGKEFPEQLALSLWRC